MKLSSFLRKNNDFSDPTLEHQQSSTRVQPEVQKVTAAAWTMCILGIAFYCYEYYLRVAPSVMRLELKTAFNLSETAFGHLAACYYYAYTPMQIPVGMLLDRFGLRKTLTFACFCCALGTYFFSITNSLSIAQMSRFLIGFGSAFAYVGVLKISDLWLPKKYFAMMTGITTALGMFGAMTGGLTMAYFIEKWGWRTTLIYASIVGFFLTLLIWLAFRNGPTNKYKNPVQKTNLASNKFSLKDSRILHGFFMILKNKTMWLNGLIGCLTFLPISAFAELWAVPFLETLGFDRQKAALGASMIFLGFAMGGPLWGIFSDYIQSRKIPLVIGSFVSAFFAFLVIFFPNNSTGWMYTLLFLLSFAASAQILVFAVGNDLNAKEVSATAASFTNMVVMLGGAILPPIIGKILDSMTAVSKGLPILTVADYQMALLVLPIALSLAGFLSMILRESYKTVRISTQSL